MLVEDHRQRAEPHFSAEDVQPGTDYWLPDDTHDTPARHMPHPGPLPADAQGPARDVQSGQSISKAGRAVEIDLEARQARHVLLGEPKTHEGAMP